MITKLVNISKNLLGEIKDIISAYSNQLHYQRKPQENLIIFDDIYPGALSPFRLYEFNYYLLAINKTVVYTTGTALPLVGVAKKLDQVIKEFENRFPALRNRVFSFNKYKRLKAKLGYTVFLNNVEKFLAIFEKNNIPFVFTLYPGGGFELNQENCDRRLKRIFDSSLFRMVIVTQKLTYDYLIDKKLCDPQKIKLIYGVVLPTEIYCNTQIQKSFYKKDKNTLDICFVAHKYTSQGQDKGYDIFIEVAKLLAQKYSDIYFHVVGNFDETVIDVSQIRDRIKFYGPLITEQFAHFYSTKDLILSPNNSFLLSPGAFDGFPTGSCVEAGLNEVALFVTDTLKQNYIFNDGVEIKIITNCFQEIFNQIEYYYTHIEELYELAHKGKELFWKIFHIDAQMTPRVQLLVSEMERKDDKCY